jgi:hypothetical protein
MIRIKSFKIFINESQKSLDSKQQEFLDSVCKDKSTWEQSVNGLINVKGNFLADDMGLKDLFGIRFGKIEGDFDISDNDLKTLEGSPKEVEGDFNCSLNYLNSLEGGPTSVRGTYICANNNLFNLDFIANDFESLYAPGNDLEYLGNLPQKIKGNLFINNNKLLKSLAGSPKIVDGDYECSGCKLESLNGAPKIVGGDFNCEHNELDSLAGGPESVGGEFLLSYNNVGSLEDIATGTKAISIIRNPISSLQGIDFKSINEIYHGQNSLPRQMIDFQLEYLRQKGNLDGWVREYIEDDPKWFAQVLNLLDSDENRKKLDNLNLINLSFENPKVLLQVITHIGPNSLLYRYLKDNMDKFSKEFQEASGLYSDLKDLGF